MEKKRSRRRPARRSWCRRETPHTYWNAGGVPARYLLILTPNIARLLEEIHEPGADIPAIFARYDSEILR